MRKIRFSNGVEFPVVNIFEINGEYEIQFGDVDFQEIQKIYDSYNNPTFDESVLRRFELIDAVPEGEEVIMGIHVGYTEVTDISLFHGNVTVRVKKESSLKTDVSDLKDSHVNLERTVAGLLLKMANGGV